MIKKIAETAWHHEGDFEFMCNLVKDICVKTSTDYVKLHITLDLDEYMSTDHENYQMQTPWLFSQEQWSEIIAIVRLHNKKLMLLLNDTRAIEFAAKHHPEAIELHSVCLNVPRLQNAVIKYIDSESEIVIGVGGSTLEEVDQAVSFFSKRKITLMFGFQNYPTKYKNINLAKIRKIQAMYPKLKYGYADHTAWNEPNNELITLLGVANNMHCVEKHVTTKYGVDRCDYSAAISIDMFNSLSEGVNVLNQITGSGNLSLNHGELQYSQVGLMKMSPFATKDLAKNDIISEGDFDFIRTSQVGGVTQIGSISMIGKALNKDIKKGRVLKDSNLI